MNYLPKWISAGRAFIYLRPTADTYRVSAYRDYLLVQLFQAYGAVLTYILGLLFLFFRLVLLRPSPNTLKHSYPDIVFLIFEIVIDVFAFSVSLYEIGQLFLGFQFNQSVRKPLFPSFLPVVEFFPPVRLECHSLLEQQVVYGLGVLGGVHF